jgi:hypothetical protein
VSAVLVLIDRTIAVLVLIRAVLVLIDRTIEEL